MMCNDAARDSPTKGAYSTSPLAGSRSGLANLDPVMLASLRARPEVETDIGLVMSALVSAILRIEMVKSHSSQREAAQSMAHVFKNIARTCEN
jgi:hypothetical protein